MRTAPLNDRDLRALEPVLLRFAQRATGDAVVAEELTQEALAAAIVSRDAFSGRSSLRTWVVGILAHKIADHFRARRFEPMADDDDPSLLDTTAAADLERVLIARQEIHRVERALAALPARERLAVLLTDVEGLERAEVCQALDVSPGYLRLVLHRARNRLRRDLGRN